MFILGIQHLRSLLLNVFYMVPVVTFKYLLEALAAEFAVVLHDATLNIELATVGVIVYFIILVGWILFVQLLAHG